MLTAAIQAESRSRSGSGGGLGGRYVTRAVVEERRSV